MSHYDQQHNNEPGYKEDSDVDPGGGINVSDPVGETGPPEENYTNIEDDKGAEDPEPVS